MNIPSTTLRTLAAGAIFSALALSFTPVSSAQDNTTPPQVIVKYADLDVSTSIGAVALYRRIHGAADVVCSRMYTGTEAYRWRKNDCQHKVIADAVTRVNAPALSAVFASKYAVPAHVLLVAAGNR